MRIVGGRRRGRRLDAPAGRDVRPTTDRVRESLFNVLAHSGWGPDGGDPVSGATVLDAFCGTGALALEALSRGAARAVLMDVGPVSLDIARRNVAHLGEGDRATVLRADATRPPPARESAGLVFLDPPYGRDLTGPALAALDAAGWLAEGCLCVVEAAKTDDPAPPTGFVALGERRYGDTKVLFWRRRTEDG
ncbi:MAG TPA: 16S rRNA (guanine(966)-N(2))-methyltransferase RsmD [Alphaproteobacteria bacterium]|nr:16S rRNA (guanine(966)-N(2))-methyltransferase RsmD [Alphaproteobacteria bacterium]